MEFQLRPIFRDGISAVRKRLSWFRIGWVLPGVAILLMPEARADLRAAQRAYQAGQYFRAAREAFAAKNETPALSGMSYAWLTVSLLRANLPHAASYFFVRTLQTGNREAIRHALKHTEPLILAVGGDFLRPYLLKHTQISDFEPEHRGAYAYSSGKEALLRGKTDDAILHLSQVPQQSPLWPYALQMRGSAHAISGGLRLAISDFKECIETARQLVGAKGQDPEKVRLTEREADDLKSRCQAGVARTLYQADRFDEAERAYDQIPKASIVWPDILFEQAWNGFARQEYNRTLGKLVSYKSPALSFVYNSEVDVLRAHTYLMLCLYADANQAIHDFNKTFTPLGNEVKAFVESHDSRLESFFEEGKRTLQGSLYSPRSIDRMMNRFIRAPYFRSLVDDEREIGLEREAIRTFAARQAEWDPSSGLPAFLDEVLRFRLRTTRALGGAFVKNSLMDYHATLLSDFEKMSYIKLEMLKVAKEDLLEKMNQLRRGAGGRDRGNQMPARRPYQYYWTFNGEFWDDELGDYIFNLESECKRAGRNPSALDSIEASS